MHIHHLDQWKHDHVFLDEKASTANERRVFYVVLLTFVMMLIEISAGIIFNSMALLADGWHMATHAGALGLTVFAYRYARAHAKDDKFTFGVGKVEILGGYTNAILLGIVALFVAYESRRSHDQPARHCIQRSDGGCISGTPGQHRQRLAIGYRPSSSRPWPWSRSSPRGSSPPRP